MFRQSFFSMVSSPSIPGQMNRISAGSLGKTSQNSGNSMSSACEPARTGPSTPVEAASGERLTVFATRWLQSLPVPVRPVITARRHPHIINRMALAWGDHHAVADYFDSLLISSRPDRRGFAVEVLDELVDLQQAFMDGRIG